MTEAICPIPREPLESSIDRARRLADEARTACLAEKDDLIADLQRVANRCAEVATLESLPVGLRDAFRQIGAGIETGLQTAQSITLRTS